MSAPAQIVSLERLESKTTALANLINFILPRKPYAAAVRAAELVVAANVGWPLVRNGIGPTWEGMLHRRMALETRQPLPWVHDQAQVELLMLRSRRARNWEFWDSRIHLDRPDMQVRLTDFFARKVGVPGTVGADAIKVEPLLYEELEVPAQSTPVTITFKHLRSWSRAIGDPNLIHSSARAAQAVGAPEGSLVVHGSLLAALSLCVQSVDELVIPQGLFREQKWKWHFKEMVTLPELGAVDVVITPQGDIYSADKLVVAAN